MHIRIKALIAAASGLFSASLAVATTAATFDAGPQPNVFGVGVLKAPGAPLAAGPTTQTIGMMQPADEPPILALHTNDFTTLALLRGQDSARFMPVGIELMAGELVGVLGRVESDHPYGARTVVAPSGGDPVVFGRVGFAGVPSGIDPADVDEEDVHTLSRDPSSYTVSNLPGTVPEPDRWAMMIAGFGLTGGALRWRRRTAIGQGGFPWPHKRRPHG